MLTSRPCQKQQNSFSILVDMLTEDIMVVKTPNYPLILITPFIYMLQLPISFKKGRFEADSAFRWKNRYATYYGDIQPIVAQTEVLGELL